MSQIKPFCAYRPKAGLAEKVASVPYDEIGVDRARAELKARFLSRFAADVIAEDFPELAARMTQRTAVLDWHARQMELLAE